MLKVGITGGIGSGKTTICKIFESLGVPVYYADERAKWLMMHDLALKNAICDIFSAAAYNQEGTLNRTYISDIIFKSSDKRRQLNELVHPAVQKDAAVWQFSQPAGTKYSLKESALLFESGANLYLDKIITVSAPKKIRIKRVQKRDQIPRTYVLNRMLAQWTDAQREQKADFVIKNNGQVSLLKQIINIHKLLIHNV